MAVVARELGLVLINLFVIAHSCIVITTELGVLKINWEVRAPEAQENDPFTQLVLPRVLGMAAAMLCLKIVFVS